MSSLLAFSATVSSSDVQSLRISYRILQRATFSFVCPLLLLSLKKKEHRVAGFYFGSSSRKCLARTDMSVPGCAARTRIPLSPFAHSVNFGCSRTPFSVPSYGRAIGKLRDQTKMDQASIFARVLPSIWRSLHSPGVPIASCAYCWSHEYLSKDHLAPLREVNDHRHLCIYFFEFLLGSPGHVGRNILVGFFFSIFDTRNHTVPLIPFDHVLCKAWAWVMVRTYTLQLILDQ